MNSQRIDFSADKPAIGTEEEYYKKLFGIE